LPIPEWSPSAFGHFVEPHLKDMAERASRRPVAHDVA
jgi:hypothetical protein